MDRDLSPFTLENPPLGDVDFGPLTSKRSRVLPSWITPFRVFVVLALIAGAIFAYTYSKSKNVTYTTAFSKIGSVSQTITAVATVVPSAQSVVDFATSGTVAAVDVKAGQSVSAGQVIASLDTSAINATLQGDNQILASDQLKYSNDVASETTTTTSPPTTLVNQGPSISQLQAQLVTSENSLSDALAQVSSLCGPTAQSTSGTLTSTATTTTTQVASGRSNSSTTQTSTSSSQVNGAYQVSGGSNSISTQANPTPTTTATAQSCSSSIAAANADSEQVKALVASLSKAASSMTTASGGTPTGAQSTLTGRGSATATKPATSTQIAVDSANIALAEANVQAATTSLSLATLKAPISGVVAAVGLTPGQSVNGTSNTNQFVIVGSGSSYQANFSVSATQLPLIHLNQVASVTPDQTARSVKGYISSIGAISTTTSSASSTATYPITVVFSSNNLGNLSGGQAVVSIKVAYAANTVVVPTSAVTTNGNLSYVTTLKGSSTSKVAVKVGVVGSIYTQVISGLTQGQEVVLANSSIALPTTSLLTNRFGGLGGGAGRFGGGAGRALRNSLG